MIRTTGRQPKIGDTEPTAEEEVVAVGGGRKCWRFASSEEERS
jgi:hypothetical protein